MLRWFHGVGVLETLVVSRAISRANSAMQMYILRMSTAPRNLTVRVVSLRSPEAGDIHVAGTPSKRVALVAVLSADLRARTKAPLPVYTRAAMPLTVPFIGRAAFSRNQRASGRLAALGDSEALGGE